MKSLRLVGVNVTERTWPLFPSGFTGMSLIFKVSPAALPIDRWRELSAVNLRVIPGSRISPEFAELPSAATRGSVVWRLFENGEQAVCDTVGSLRA